MLRQRINITAPKRPRPAMERLPVGHPRRSYFPSFSEKKGDERTGRSAFPLPLKRQTLSCLTLRRSHVSLSVLRFDLQFPRPPSSSCQAVPPLLPPLPSPPRLSRAPSSYSPYAHADIFDPNPTSRRPYSMLHLPLFQGFLLPLRVNRPLSLAGRGTSDAVPSRMPWHFFWSFSL